MTERGRGRGSALTFGRLVAAFGLLATPYAVNAAAAAPDWSQCAVYRDDDRRRLECYDDVTARRAAGDTAQPATAPGTSGGGTAATHPPGNSAPPATVLNVPPSSPAAPAIAEAKAVELRAQAKSYLTDVWRLDARDARLPLTDIQPYQPIYVLFGNWTSNVNRTPASPAPDHVVTSPLQYESTEAKFQLSFKSQLWADSWSQSHLGFNGYRVWFAYTQQSYWQVYNGGLSRPFRETDYEPEFIVTLPRSDPAANWKMINLGALHESNGRSNPQSRSWNRLYLQSGWEFGEISVLGRVWWRIPENYSRDDNPDITSYMGRGDVVLRYSHDDWITSLLLRSTLRLNPDRGFAQFDLFTPKLKALGNTRAYLQMTTGYGDSMIDYNFKQTTIGLGLSFGDHW